MLYRTKRLLPMLLLGLLGPGCLATQQDLKDAHGLTQKTVQETGDSLSQQHKAMHPEAEKAIESIDRVYKERFAEIQKTMEEMKSRLGAEAMKVVAMAVQMGERFAGMATGLPVTGLTAPIVEEMRRNAGNNDLVLAGLERRLGEGREEIRLIKADVVSATNRLGDLSQDLVTKLAATDEKTFAKLESLRNDRDALFKTLRDELKLSDAEIESLKSMTTEEILALLAAAVGAAGAGIAGGRFGKSRSADTVAEIKKKVDSLPSKPG